MAELDESVTVHIVMLVRKLLEWYPDDIYESLRFHCHWALHTTLERGMAKKVLELFEDANQAMVSDASTFAMPYEMQEITALHRMQHEMRSLLIDHGITNTDEFFHNWGRFMLHYACVISDSPLVIKSSNVTSSVVSVTVDVDVANEVQDGQRWFRINWNVARRTGLPGTFFTLNSFPEI